MRRRLFFILALSGCSFAGFAQAPAGASAAPEETSGADGAVVLGTSAGRELKGLELFALSQHGGGIVAVQKHESSSRPEILLGLGGGGAWRHTYVGGFIIAAGGGRIGAGLGLALRAGFRSDRFFGGAGVQAVAGTRQSHSEAMAFLGIRLGS